MDLRITRLLFSFAIGVNVALIINNIRPIGLWVMLAVFFFVELIETIKIVHITINEYLKEGSSEVK